MTKASLLLLALAAGAPLLAQAPGLTVTAGDSSVTLYGILDVGVANVAHTLDFSTFVAGANPTLTKFGNTSATGMMNGGISQTRWGLKGQTDLGGGWKGVFNLESAINLHDGQIANSGLQYYKANGNPGTPVSADTSLDGGALFGRNANVGMSNDTYGTLTFGRHTSLMLDAIPSFDALQGAQMFTPIGFSGSYGGGGATDNSRVDSSLKYKLKVGDFTVGGVYKFGGVSGATNAKTVGEFNLIWERGGFGVMAAYQYAVDTTSIGNPAGTIDPNALMQPSAEVSYYTYTDPVTLKVTVVPSNNPKGAVLTASTVPAYLALLGNHTAVYEPIGTVTVTAYDTHATMLAARYKVGSWLFTAGYELENYINPSNPTIDAAITSVYNIPVGLWTSNLSGTAAVAPAVNVAPYTIGGAQMRKTLTVYWGGVRYDFTKKFNAAVSYYHVGQNDFSNGTGTAADLSGTTTYLSALLDYNYSKAFDAYLGYMNTKGTDGMVAGFTNDNNTIFGVGIRYRF